MQERGRSADRLSRGAARRTIGMQRWRDLCSSPLCVWHRKGPWQNSHRGTFVLFRSTRWAAGHTLIRFVRYFLRPPWIHHTGLHEAFVFALFVGSCVGMSACRPTTWSKMTWERLWWHRVTANFAFGEPALHSISTHGHAILSSKLGTNSLQGGVSTGISQSLFARPFFMLFFGSRRNGLREQDD